MSGLERPRLQDLGIGSGEFERGSFNAITDVPGILVGHSTIADERYRTGVTAIVPEQLTFERRTLRANLAVGNGYGKFVGATQLTELGVIETPILLTSTLSVFQVADALLGEMLQRPGYEETVTLNPVVGETNDGSLSAIRDRPVGREHVVEALTSARSGQVEEGCVGAGTGTTTLGYKGGIGSSSRRVTIGETGYTVGAIVQSNFTGELRIAGVRMPASELLSTASAEPVGNSCMIVVATDAPLDARQLGRVARRAIFAMRSVGADFDQGSGDYAIAFSTTRPESSGPSAACAPPPDEQISPLFRATMLAVEEALLNSVLRATTTHGVDGHTAFELPIEEAKRRLAAAGATQL